jgi:hypothetical protein
MTVRSRELFLTRATTVANIGLVAGAALSLFVFGYLFYSYTLTGQRQFVSALFAFLYYALPLSVAAGLLASLRLAPTRRIGLLILCCTVTISIYVMEVALWFWYPAFGPAQPVMTALLDSADRQREAARLKTESGVDIDARNRGEVLAALREAEHDAVPAIPPNTILGRYGDGRITPLNVNGNDLIPLAGVSNRLTLLCNESGQWIRFRSDRRGFNNPDSVWDLDRAELVAVGDSFAQGHCVSPDRNFVALIRKQYPATLNLGMAGDGPLLALATLKEFAPPIKPRVVLWCYFEGNDLEELQSERGSPLLRKYLSGRFSQGELKRQNDVDDAILAQIPQLQELEETRRRHRAEQSRMRAFLRSRLTLATLRQTAGLVGGMQVDPDAAADFETANLDVFSQVLRDAQAVVAEWGGQLVFVYLPEWAHYTRAVSRGEQYHDDVIAVTRRLGIRTIDVSRTFDQYGDPLSLFPFRQPGHYNETGHRLTAESVLAALSPQLP